MTSPNVSGNTTSPYNDGIDDVNDAVVSRLTPALVFIAVLIATGIVGNLLVLYIFMYRLKMTTQNFFIVCLAVFDVIGCFVSMPGEIVDMVLYYKHTYVIVCKSLRFILVFSSLASCLTLLCIAVDRFRKVCRHHEPQMTIRHAQLSLIPVVAVSLLLAWPEPVLYGIRTVETEIPGITGHDCTFSDNFKNTNFPIIYNSFLCVAFLAEMISLVVLYAFILRVLRKHRWLLKGLHFNTTTYPQDEATGRQSRCVVCVIMDKTTSTDNDITKACESELHQREDMETKTSENDPNTKLQKLPPKIIEKENGSSNLNGCCVCRGLNSLQNHDFGYSRLQSFGDYTKDASQNNQIAELEAANQTQVCISSETKPQVLELVEDIVPSNLLTPTTNYSTNQNNLQNAETKTKIELSSTRNETSQNLREAPTTAETNLARKYHTPKRSGRVNISTKTTLIAFSVTVAFLVSYLPHLSFQAAKLVKPSVDEAGPLLALYNIIVRSYFLNTVVNPVIYGVLNLQFRQEVKNLARKVSCLRTKKL